MIDHFHATIMHSISLHTLSRCNTHSVKAAPTYNNNTTSSVCIRRAQTSIEYRAAGYLRAESFAAFPSGNGTSDFARRQFILLKAEEKWRELEELVASNNPTIIPLIATSTSHSLKIPSLCIPGESHESVEWVVGTLDINFGPKLSSEELIGDFPSGEYSHRRAYLSNVCVAGPYRRKRVATDLITCAQQEIQRQAPEISDLYVHVVHDNMAARELYNSDACGFQIVKEESVGVARALNRPRRLLLHKRIVR